MPKLPFMKFFPADFITDTQTLSVEQIGCWIKLMCYIWLSSKTGTVKLSNQEIAHLWGIEIDEAMGIFCLLWEKDVFDNKRTILGENHQQDDPNHVINTITSRRISRDKKELKMNAFYSSKHRSRGLSKEKVRDKKTEDRRQNINIVDSPSDRLNESRFAEIWAKYPNKDGRKAAERSFMGSVKTDQDWAAICKALDVYLKHLAREAWKKPKNGSTWFNNWRDWIDWQDETSGIALPSPEKQAAAQKRKEDLIERLREKEDERLRGKANLQRPSLVLRLPALPGSDQIISELSP